MKQVKCPNCHDKREVPEDTAVPICGACQEEMEEYVEVYGE